MARTEARPGWQYHEKLDNAFHIEYKDMPGTSKTGYHVHDQYEMMLCLSEDMFLKVDKEHYDISSNTLMLFNSMDLHYFGTKRPGAENRRYVLYFEPSYIGYLSYGHVNLLDCFLYRPFPDGWILKLSKEQAGELRGQLDKILELDGRSEEECYGKELHLQLLLAEVLLNVNTLYRSYHHITNSTDQKSLDSVYDIIHFIHSHYGEEITLDLLSQRFYINKFSLCEMFRQVAGTTPNQYIINCRIAKAKELLMNGCSVERVCGEAGFNNLSHFSRTFKTKVGISPKQYQKSGGRLC